MILDDIAENPDDDLLATPIEKLEKVAPLPITSRTTIKAAAKKLASDRGQCLVLDATKVVTPWDLVMKPWLAGKLTIR